MSSPDELPSPSPAERRRRALRDCFARCPVLAIVTIDDPHCRPALARLEELLRAGLRVAQLRLKRLPDSERLPIARAARDLTHAHDAALLINDRVDLALACDAEGVHLGAEDLPVDVARQLLGDERWIGATVHEPARLQEISSADYAGVGTIYTSRTKPERTPAGLERLRQLVPRLAPRPVVAIGGIDATNAAACFRAGAHAVAVGAALMHTDAPAATLAAIAAARRTQG